MDFYVGWAFLLGGSKRGTTKHPLFPSFPLSFLSAYAAAALTFAAAGKQPLAGSEEGCASSAEQCEGQNTKWCQVCGVNKLQSHNSFSFIFLWLSSAGSSDKTAFWDEGFQDGWEGTGRKIIKVV